MKRTAIRTAVFLAFIFAAFEATAEKVWTTDGRVINATAVRFKKTTNEYIITMAAGGTELPLPKSRVKAVEVSKPAKYDQAASAVKGGAMAQAIPVLEELALDYFMLSPWDAQILDLLGYAYSRTPDPAKATATYKKMLTTAAPASISLDMQRRAWAALTATRDSSLASELDRTIAQGSRENAAAAHIARGDMARAEGNRADALLDYLRVVILYEQVKTMQPEALYKAAVCLEELKDPRAEDWRKKLMNEYGSSEWAQRK